MGFNWVWLSQDIWAQVSLPTNVNKTGQFSQHRWPETRTVHSLSPYSWIWFWKPGCEAEVNTTRLQVVSAKPLMQTSGEARRGNGTAIPARIQAELSQTHQNHQAGLVASKPKCAQVQLHLLLPQRVQRQLNFSLPVPPWFDIPALNGCCIVRNQLQCLRIFIKQQDELFESLHEIVKQIVQTFWWGEKVLLWYDWQSLWRVFTAWLLVLKTPWQVELDVDV